LSLFFEVTKRYYLKIKTKAKGNKFQKLDSQRKAVFLKYAQGIHRRRRKEEKYNIFFGAFTFLILKYSEPLATPCTTNSAFLYPPEPLL